MILKLPAASIRCNQPVCSRTAIRLAARRDGKYALLRPVNLDMMQAHRSLRTISTLARHSARATPFLGSRFPDCSRCLQVNFFAGWTGESLPLAQSSAGQHLVLAAAPQACVQQTHRRQRCAGARRLPSAPGSQRPCHGTVCGGASAQAPPAPAPPTAGADSAMRGSSQRHVSQSCTWASTLASCGF